MRIQSVLLVLPLLAARLTSQSPAAAAITITNATVIDVSNGSLHPGTTVVINGNRIVSVRSTSGAAPQGVVIDAKGMYLIPGLWDMHVHSYYSGTVALSDDYVLPLFIANGITGVRDMGSDLDQVLRARGEIAAHQRVGPRMIVAGPMLEGPQSRGKTTLPLKTAADGAHAVDSLKARGVDFIKVQSGVPRDAYFGVAAEAKKIGIAFEGHVPDEIRASEAIAAGQRSFEHLIGVFEASTPDEDDYLLRHYGGAAATNKTLKSLLDRYDPAREAKLIQVLAKNGIWQCPTLFWERGQWLVDVTDWRKDPDSLYTPRSWLDRRFASMQGSISRSLGTDSLVVRQRFVQHELDIVRKMQAAGVPLLAGTDSPAGVNLTPGISLHLELQRFVAAGLTPLQALQTATINPARFWGKTNDYGSVQAGRIADLVLLSANPLQDIANTRTITGVIADGRYYSPADLDVLREKIRAVAASH